MFLFKLLLKITVPILLNVEFTFCVDSILNYNLKRKKCLDKNTYNDIEI